MKFTRTSIFALFFFVVAAGVYFFDYRREEKKEQQKDVDFQILNFDRAQINMLEIAKKDEKIVLQKSETGWALLEPIQDRADSDQIEDLIKSITDEKMLALAKESTFLTESDLNEYGLDQPLATYIIKNNLGQSKKIIIGTQKNFEGNSYIRIDSENKIYVAGSVWFKKAENKLIYYREKRLYRFPLAEVTGIKVVSLRDHFELKRKANLWASSQFEHILDQNKVREMLRKISESTIQDYVYDGEPSEALIEEKGLSQKGMVHIEFATAEATWSVDINENEKENAVYALTDRPTRLVRLDNSSWEFFGDLNLDALRDRVSVTRFNIDAVEKAYIKYKNRELNFEKIADKWKLKGVEDQSLTHLFPEMLQKIHDLEISEFIDSRQTDQFKGADMIILKSAENNLVYQMNWGPEFKMKKLGKEKSYFYARTQISSSIFAIEKERIDKIELEKLFKKLEETTEKKKDVKHESAPNN